MVGKLPKMSTREVMVSLSGRAPGYGELPRWMKTMAEKAGLSTRMVRSLWNNEISDPDHWAIKKLKREAELAEARKETAALANQYQKMIGGMRAADENFYSTEIDRLERLVRIIGALDRT